MHLDRIVATHRWSELLKAGVVEQELTKLGSETNMIDEIGGGSYSCGLSYGLVKVEGRKSW